MEFPHTWRDHGVPAVGDVSEAPLEFLELSGLGRRHTTVLRVGTSLLSAEYRLVLRSITQLDPSAFLLVLVLWSATSTPV